VLLTGAVIAIGALVVAAWLFVTRRPEQAFGRLNPRESILVWENLRQNLDRRLPWETFQREQSALFRRWMGVTLTVAALGGLTMLASRLIPARGPGQRRKPPVDRVQETAARDPTADERAKRRRR
jgi:hypothetical protein